MGRNLKVLMTARMHEDGIKLIQREAQVIFPKKPPDLLTSEDIIGSGIDIDGMIVVTNVERVTREVIEALPKLKIVARHGVGFDNVDVKAASERGIYVTTAPVLDETVADQAFALLLCLCRNTCRAHHYVMSKEWKIRDPYIFMGTDVWGKTIGIVGLGRIGSKIAQRAAGFNMKILYFDIIRKPELERQFRADYKPLNELLRESDLVMIACALTDETRGMIGEKELALMKDSGLLVNVARGPIVNHDSLVNALRERRIAGAGLDAFDQEPIPLNDALLALENVVLTPHLAPNTVECRRRMATTVAEEVLRVFHGETPRYSVNLQIRGPRT